jgi:outer membrane protein assembly factor BamB
MNPSLHRFAITLLFPTSLALFATAGDWPHWQGPTRDGYLPKTGPVPTTLPKELKPTWKVSAGGGFSAPIVADGKVVLLDDDGAKEFVHVFDAKTGKLLWKKEYAPALKDNWGSGPRATPFIDGDRLYVQAFGGEFRCFSLKDGRILWGMSFEKDFGYQYKGPDFKSGATVRYGNNGCGLVEGDAVILPVGSPANGCLIAFDKNTGSQLWKSGEDETAYSSLKVATLAGVKQIIAFTAYSLIGVDRQTGKLLWRVPVQSAANRHAASPVFPGNDTVIINSHTVGTICYKITKDGSGFKASVAWENKPLKTNLSTPAIVGDYAYNQGAGKTYVCFNAKTGEVKWTQPGFGDGRRDYSATLVAGDKLLVLTEAGQLLLLAANPEKYTELGRLQVCGGTWSFPAYADGKLFVRDSRELSCYPLVN